MILSKDDFTEVIKNTPLISIDLIIENREGKILLGKRVNQPAKDYWFVPGGRIFKDETLQNAFSRTVYEELGVKMEKKEAQFQGVYEHFYNDNVFNDDFSTHYIGLAHRIKLEDIVKTNDQHGEYRWFEKDELLKSENVHKYTKDYFNGKITWQISYTGEDNIVRFDHYFNRQ